MYTLQDIAIFLAVNADSPLSDAALFNEWARGRAGVQSGSAELEYAEFCSLRKLNPEVLSQIAEEVL